MSQPITTEDLLRRARQIITPEEKWGKYRFDDGRGAHCALGALGQAAKDLGAGSELTHAALERLAATLYQLTGIEHIPSYNDDRLTGHEDILRLFDAAIGGK